MPACSNSRRYGLAGWAKTPALDDAEEAALALLEIAAQAARGTPAIVAGVLTNVLSPAACWANSLTLRQHRG